MSKIEWTDETWNPLTGCTRVSAGCDNCYAARQAAGRLKNTPAYEGLAVITKGGRAAFNGRIRLLPERLDQPLRWRKPRRVFVNSMSDLFHEAVPDDFIDRVFAVMALTPQHTYQILTKRPERMTEYMNGSAANGLAREMAVYATASEPARWPAWPLPNVWLGTSCEDQSAFDQRAHWLAKTPAAVRFLSLEPLLGPIWWGVHTVSIPWAGGEARGGRGYSMLMDFIHWVIIGGESGPRARPFDVEWARSLLKQCRDARVAAFYKQGGASNRCPHDAKGGCIECVPEDLRIREYPNAS